MPTDQLFWGAAYGGNTEPGSRYGSPGIGLGRTYWNMSNAGSSVIRAASDASKGRLPWVSYKVGGWAAFANGGQDAAFRSLLTQLNGIGTAVWLTVHHEPEGSGRYGTDESTPSDNSSINDWKNAQRHVRDLMEEVGTQNIAFAPVLMGWTWDERSNRVPASWIDGMAGVWDFFGIDCYNDTTNPAVQKFEDMAMWRDCTADLTARGYQIGIGEWGTRGSGADIAAQHADFLDKGIIGAAYFDSDLNSPTGGWSLTSAQLPVFNTFCLTSSRV